MTSPAPLATLACSGAAGTVKPGWELNVVLGAAGIAALIERRTNRDVAEFLGALIATIQVDPLSVCSQPDPGDPNLGQADFSALVNYSDIIAFGAAVLRLRQWWIHLIWPIWCDCTDGTHPGDAVLSPLPNVSVNPGLPGGQVGGNCWHATGSFPEQAVNATWFNTLQPKTTDITPAAPPAGQKPQVFPSPAPVTVGVTVTAHNLVPANTLWAWTAQFVDANGAIGSLGQFQSPSLTGNVSYSASGVVPTGAASIQILAQGPNPIQTGMSYEAELTYYCPGQSPTSTIVPCCPPDPLVTGILQQILGYVTLLQRQVAPFAYVPGATHLAVTGHGELSVQGLLGVKITPTVIPAGSGVDLGDPDTLWLDSWINWGNADGWTTREWLRSAPHVSLPSLAGQFTKLGFTLRPGLTVEIQELKREP